MNCLEFRRLLATDPTHRDAAFNEHRANCAACAEAAQRADAFEAQLARALSVPAPAGLADQILLHQTTQSRRQPRAFRGPMLWRIAAAVVLMLGAGLVAYTLWP